MGADGKEVTLETTLDENDNAATYRVRFNERWEGSEAKEVSVGVKASKVFEQVLELQALHGCSRSVTFTRQQQLKETRATIFSLGNANVNKGNPDMLKDVLRRPTWCEAEQQNKVGPSAELSQH
ncbi:hypothetical protein V8G54_016096 [Vigna mungo]|uniref:Uncharacterized protein n=1 Tax=Vigna mungo TaxID=3915 RepID=A0AAQ3S0T0_VIGMU